MSEETLEASTHAKLSPSGSSGWMNCPGKPEAEKGYPDTSNIHSATGTAAHHVASESFEAGKPASEFMGTKITVDNSPEGDTSGKHVYEIEVDRKMVNNVQGYLDYIDNLAFLKDLERVEVEVEYGQFVPDGKGTSDYLAVVGPKLYVIDYKNGRGAVSAEWNSQGMIYAVGALEWFRERLPAYYHQIEEIEIIIYQPNTDGDADDVFEISKEDLIDWAENVLKPAAIAASDPSAPRIPGDAQCAWCKAKHDCKERNGWMVKQIDVDFSGDFDEWVEETDADEMELPNVDRLSAETLAEFLPIAARIEKWAKELKGHAQTEAVDHGVKIPGYKLVKGRGSRKWADETKARKGMQNAGYKVKEITTEKLISVAEFEKLAGKDNKVFNSKRVQYVKYSDGKPTLVPESDKREEYIPEDEFAELTAPTPEPEVEDEFGFL